MLQVEFSKWALLSPLFRESGVLLRHCIVEKALPKPIGRGRGARYDDRRVMRVRVALQLRSTDPSLGRSRLRMLSRTDDELRALLSPYRRRPRSSHPFRSGRVIELMPGMR